ncbi:MAG TPA: hypothetical protein VGL56_09720 [Fimbriimonadaceae bacterium]|jgi:hypothetical protein
MVISLPTRKVEGLMAILALHPRFGVERDVAGEMLWPERPLEVQRTNLRQTLSLLRRFVGEDAVESSRSHCRLSSSFRFRSDYDDVELRDDKGFMPGHEGEWFEQIRSGATESEEAELLVQTPISSFVNTLTWLASYDPNGLYALLKASKSLTRGIAPRALIPILDQGGLVELHAGWSAYWRGCAEDNLSHCAVLLETALQEARRTKDWELGSEVCLELGKVYSRTARIEEAKKILALAETIAERNGSTEALANATRLKGTLFIHWGDPVRGLAYMARAEELIQDPLDRAVLAGARAFFAASAGLDQVSEAALALPLKLKDSSGHRRIAVLCATTQCVLAARGSGLRAVPEQLSELSDQLYKMGWLQFGVYADEILAKAFNLAGEGEMASNRLKSAAQGRRVSSMVKTPLETKLIESVGG